MTATQRVDMKNLIATLINHAYDDGDADMPCMSEQTKQARDALLQQLAELERSYQESCDITRDWIAANNALSARATEAEAKLAERDAEIERLGECLRVFICDCQQWSYDSLDTEGGKRIALEWMTRYNGNKRRAEAAERAREGATELLREVHRNGWGQLTISDLGKAPLLERIAAFLAANGGRDA